MIEYDPVFKEERKPNSCVKLLTLVPLLPYDRLISTPDSCVCLLFVLGQRDNIFDK